MNLIVMIGLSVGWIFCTAPDAHSTLDACIERCAETLRANAIAQHNARLSEGLRVMRVEIERAASTATNVRKRTTSALDSSHAALSSLEAAGGILVRALGSNVGHFLHNPTTASEQHRTEHLILWDNIVLLKQRIEEQKNFAKILQHEQKLYDELAQNAQEFYEARTSTELRRTHAQAMLAYSLSPPPVPEQVVSADDVQKTAENAKTALVELEIFQKEVIEFSRLSSEMCKGILGAARLKYPAAFTRTHKPQNTSKFSCFSGLLRL